MTQEEKRLLLIDLSARLFYGVKVKYYKDKCDCTLNDINFKFKVVWITADDGSNDSLNFESIGEGVWQLKPYLRPMSSMTEKEQKEYDVFCCKPYLGIDETTASNFIDWLNAHHFDYRGLIPMGLALEAPEGMYDTKTK